MRGEIVVLMITATALLMWAYYGFKRWLYAPPALQFPFISEQASEPEGEWTRLLQEEGYEAISGKCKVPIRFDVDGASLSARYFIDGFARKNNETWIVKLERPRQPMEWTGSSVRDRLLPYALMYGQAAGILFVDTRKRSVKKITIEFA